MPSIPGSCPPTRHFEMSAAAFQNGDSNLAIEKSGIFALTMRLCESAFLYKSGSLEFPY